jgi:hypothetical protein
MLTSEKERLYVRSLETSAFHTSTLSPSSQRLLKDWAATSRTHGHVVAALRFALANRKARYMDSY